MKIGTGGGENQKDALPAFYDPFEIGTPEDHGVIWTAASAADRFASAAYMWPGASHLDLVRPTYGCDS